ncbi:Vps54-like protein-domain-containing protein, partial [Vararia minispora EC-137]
MSDYTSNPSRPPSPVGSLRDVPSARQPAYRFQWDGTRKPGPGSVLSEATEGRGDYFNATPRVDIYGASGSATNLVLDVVPEEWSSSRHGFHAISTVVNNPHKKSAPPKAHASVPPVPPADLPRVRRKDFDAYLRAVGPEWERFQKNAGLGRSGVAHTGDGSMRISNDSDLDLLSEPRPPVTPRVGAAHPLPPLSSVPDIFFTPDFNLGDPRTFNAVAEIPSSPSSNAELLDPSRLAHSLPLLERLSRHADTLEQHLVTEIARRASPFFAALTNLQDLQAESTQCLARIQSLRAQLREVDEQGAHRGLRGVQREARLANVRRVQDGVRAIGGVIEMTGLVRNLVSAGQWGEALDVVDELHAVWEGPQIAPETVTPDPARSMGTPLDAVPEEEPRDLPAARPAQPALPLSKLTAFAALPTQLQALTLEIAGSLTADVVAVLKLDLVERVLGEAVRLDADVALRDRLRPLVGGLIRVGGVRRALEDWREVALGEVKGIIRRHVSSFELEEGSARKSGSDTPWTNELRSMSHQNFLGVLRSIYQSYLNCIEGLQSLNEILVDVINRARVTNSAIDMAAINESVFDTLASASELANSLSSQVLATRTEQNAKLQLEEFAELFRETWNFFVRCEVICRRMIVSLRGIVSSQAKAFLQAFHQTRISQSAKLVEDEQWSPTEVQPALQRTTNLIVDAAVSDPIDFVLALPPTIAPATSSTQTPVVLHPPSGLSPSSSPGVHPVSPRVRANGNGTTPSKHLRIEERGYYAVSATLEALLLLVDYLKVIINIQTLTTDTMSRVIEFLKAFNSRTCQVVLGAGAMRSAGLKNITAKHLALASQSLSIMIALIPYVRETFRRHLNPKQAVMLVEFDKLKRDFQEHQNEIHAKLIAIMGDRLATHIKVLQGIDWSRLPPSDGAHDYMKLLVKETVTLHKVLSRYLSSTVVEYVMSQVFAAINHRLSEEFTKIELPSHEAKEALMADARYLKENFSALKSAGGVPTGMLEIIVSEK